MAGDNHWQCFEPAPEVVLSNEADLGAGARFFEIESPRYGSFDSVSTALSIAWSQGPLQVRYSGSKSFQTVARRPRIFFPGDEQHGEWQGVERTLLLSVPSPVVERTVQCLSPCSTRSRQTDEQSALLEHCLRLVKADVAGGSPAGPTILDTLVTTLLSAIFPDGERSERRESAGDSRRFRLLVEYIDANLRRSLRLDEVAAQAGISVRHMTRIFKASAGLAPREYILARRVHRATELVRSGDLHLGDIAMSVGFSSHAHMTAAFRRLAGRSPSQFRNT